MRKSFILFLCVLGFAAYAADAPQVKQFTLDNGLTVYLWEDKNQPDVTGRVVVRAGSIDEPSEYTGLAHYLEHMIFKGTQKIGTLDWDKEKVHYDNIIRLYDEYAVATDKVVRDTLMKKINRESIMAAKFSLTNDYANLIEGMGGEGLNAFTSYDLTAYFNNFPSFQMEKWMEVSSERLINPVFRSFQAELENVFEEFNMYQDSRSTHSNNFLMSKLFPTHPYGRDVIGKPEHLKNPRLSKLIEFYNTWYTPRNMALVLVGNFNSELAIPMIKAKFGRLVAKDVPARVAYPEASFKGNPKFTAKVGYSPSIYWAYKGVKKGDKDELALDICSAILSNGSQTGLLDKLGLNGDLGVAAAANMSFRDEGRVLVYAVPYYDVNQRVFESDMTTEKLVMTEVNKLKNGEIEDWLIKSVKDNLLRNYDMVMETPAAKTEVLTEIFAYNLTVSDFKERNERIKAITKEEIQRVAKQYFSGDHITVSIEAGMPKKEKISKPDIKPIEQPKGKKTEFAAMVQKMPVGKVDEVYNNFQDVKSVSLYDKINLYHVENKQNDIFSLTIRYKVGTAKMPKLKYAVALLNSAGILPNDDAQKVRRQFSEINTNCNYSVNDDYFYIRLSGDEANLGEACKLMTRQMLMPKLDNKQLDRVKGADIQGRISVEQEDAGTIGNALLSYALYKDSSDYINRLSIKDVYYLKVSELTGDVIRATGYEVDIHYVGKKPVSEVEQLLKANLPLKEDVKTGVSPIVKERITYNKPTVYYLPNSDSQQSQLYFYINGDSYKSNDKVKYDAFFQYFSGGFNGLVMNEIRENNSMAYTAYGALVTPPVENKKAFFLGYVGTQGDKVADAVDLYMSLLTAMPLYPERIDNIKTYLKQSSLTDKPSFRNKSLVFNAWKQLGYSDDPAKVNMSAIENLTFDQIVSFYNENIKGKPIAIVIMGDPKTIDLKQIEAKHGKITKLNVSKLYKPIEFW